MVARVDERARKAAERHGNRRVYDLSVPFCRDMPTYYFYKSVFSPPMFTVFSQIEGTPLGPWTTDAYVTHVSFLTHIGTHVDAPRHFRRDGWSIHEIPPDRWLGEGPVLGDGQAVDVRARVQRLDRHDPVVPRRRRDRRSLRRQVRIAPDRPPGGRVAAPPARVPLGELPVQAGVVLLAQEREVRGVIVRPVEVLVVDDGALVAETVDRAQRPGPRDRPVRALPAPGIGLADQHVPVAIHLLVERHQR